MEDESTPAPAPAPDKPEKPRAPKKPTAETPEEATAALQQRIAALEAELAASKAPAAVAGSPTTEQKIVAATEAFIEDIKTDGMSTVTNMAKGYLEKILGAVAESGKKK